MERNIDTWYMENYLCHQKSAKKFNILADEVEAAIESGCKVIFEVVDSRIQIKIGDEVVFQKHLFEDYLNDTLAKMAPEMFRKIAERHQKEADKNLPQAVEQAKQILPIAQDLSAQGMAVKQ